MTFNDRMLPLQRCSRPWWPCLADSWRSSSGKDRPAFSIPSCPSACSSRRPGTERCTRDRGLCGYCLQSQGDSLRCSLTAISPGSPNIFANCHRCNDLLHSLLLLLFLIAVQLCLELKYFPCAEQRKTHLVRSIGDTKRLKWGILACVWKVDTGKILLASVIAAHKGNMGTQQGHFLKSETRAPFCTVKNE